MNEAKMIKHANHYKIKETPRSNNNSTNNLHSQSTSLWDKRSPSHGKRLITDMSSGKRGKESNRSYNETYLQSQASSHNHSINHHQN